MAELRLPEPSEKQKQFLLDQHKYIAYGGARGGGKSWAVRVKAALLCLRYPGIKVMIVRKTYPELQENHILPLCEMLGCYREEGERIAVYNDAKKHMLFPNGSRILFRYLDSDSDALRFQWAEVDVLFVDEATQQSEEKMDRLRACVRGVNRFPKRIYYTCNPGGEGHSWVKRLFIDRRFREEEEAGEHSFIQALITDNHALMEHDPDYVRQLEALPPKLRQAWRYGDWEIFEGQFFEDFRIEPDLRAAAEHGCTLTREELKKQGRWCHVIEPFDLCSGARKGWSSTAARARRTRACAGRRTGSSARSRGSNASTHGCADGISRAWPTPRSGTPAAARASPRPRPSAACTSSPATISVCRAGCSATTVCSSTRRATAGCTSLTTAGTSSGPSRR